MTEMLLFLALLVLVGAALIVISERDTRSRARLTTVVAENHDLRTLLRNVEAEARAELAAGDPAFDYLLQLITDSGYAGSDRKELPR